MKFSLEIDMATAAFGADPANEVTRILHEFAERLDESWSGISVGNSWALVDINGTKVGKARVVN